MRSVRAEIQNGVVRGGEANVLCGRREDEEERGKVLPEDWKGLLGSFTLDTKCPMGGLGAVIAFAIQRAYIGGIQKDGLGVNGVWRD